MSAPHALITGASVAGPAVATLLARAGWRTTLVERDRAFRDGGQNVDIRSAAKRVVDRMGLLGRVRDATTGEGGTEFVDDDGRAVARFPASATGVDGPTGELEILRGDLARLLIDESRSDTEYRWGDRIAGLRQDADGVDVTFDGGATGRYDVVVVAEGIRSSTRELVFGDVVDRRWLGAYVGWATVPREPGDTDWWRWYNAPGRRVMTLRPSRPGQDTVNATLSFIDDRPGIERLGAEEQIELVRRRFAGAGWQVPRLLGALDPETWYFEALTQIRAPRWSDGRVALLGDAAWAPTPLAGKGTSMALVGAYLLAGELVAAVAAGERPERAFGRYEARFRPYVEKAQKLPPGTPKTGHPETRAGIAVGHTLVRLAASRAARRAGALGDRLLGGSNPEIELPDYPALRTAESVAAD